MDWRRAFLLQAKSDYRVLQTLLTLEHIEACHRLHYLQMASEKLAKGMGNSGRKPSVTHRALRDFVRSAHGLHPSLRRALGWKSATQFQAYIKSLVPIAEAVERLAPSGAAELPNAEYPWQSFDGAVHTPCRHEYAGLNLMSSPARRLMDFLARCFHYLEQTEGI